MPKLLGVIGRLNKGICRWICDIVHFKQTHSENFLKHCFSNKFFLESRVIYSLVYKEKQIFRSYRNQSTNLQCKSSDWLLYIENTILDPFHATGVFLEGKDVERDQRHEMH